MTHVPYKGTGPAIIDTLGGQVTIMFGVPEVVPHIKSGRLAVLGVTGAKRSSALPNVPTIAESGRTWIRGQFVGCDVCADGHA